MTIHYQAPAGVHPLYLGKHIVLSTAQGGQVLVDDRVLNLWEKARDQDLKSLLSAQPSREFTEAELRSALACLCQASLLERSPAPQIPAVHPTAQGPLVSVVIVSYNSRSWLEDCLNSLVDQSYQPLEIILVDNHSSDDTVDWLATNHPTIRLIKLSRTASLAQAINSGVETAQGAYFLLLNPDVRLEPNTVAELVQTAQSEQNCAAVAAKLKLFWAPGFLNGLGNLSGAFAFGSDIGLGHLDLGQFDRLNQLPSACFAAALITRTAWQTAGPLDPAFPLYYEDIEWCYRARICGYSILAAPKSIVYHALGSRFTNSKDTKISPTRLERVVYGRLRFASKLLENPYRRRFIIRYLLEDSLRLLLALLRLSGSQVKAIWQGWMRFQQAVDIRQARISLQACRQMTDQALFEVQKDLPPPLVWHGFPLLTWDIIQSVYQPLILSGRTIQLPEFADVGQVFHVTPPSGLQRLRQILKLEGVSLLFHRLYRALQWRLSQP